MTRRFSALWASVFVVLALGALTASAASAKTGLELNSHKVHVAVGSPAVALVSVQGCFQETKGTVGVNGKTKDKLNFTGTTSTECGANTLTGNVTQIQLSTAGVASFKASLVLKMGECAYSFKKFSLAFEPSGGETIGFGEIKGKFDKAASKTKTCAKTFTTSLVAGAENSEEEPFETEL